MANIFSDNINRSRRPVNLLALCPSSPLSNSLPANFSAYFYSVKYRSYVIRLFCRTTKIYDVNNEVGNHQGSNKKLIVGYIGDTCIYTGRINIGVTFVSRKISDPLFLRVCLFFCYPIESNRRENSNLVVSTLMERVKRSVGLEQRLFRLIDRHKCYNCFPNGFLLRLAFPLPSVSSEITMRSMKFEKIKERINFPLSIRISVCHFFFPMIFRLSRRTNSILGRIISREEKFYSPNQ